MLQRPRCRSLDSRSTWVLQSRAALTSLGSAVLLLFAIRCVPQSFRVTWIRRSQTPTASTPSTPQRVDVQLVVLYELRFLHPMPNWVAAWILTAAGAPLDGIAVTVLVLMAALPV